MSTTASVTSTVESLQQAFKVINTVLSITSSNYPPVSYPANLSVFDAIIVGGGTAGTILANRLTENGQHKVLLLEAGGYPPYESELPGTFTLMPYTDYDLNYTTVKDNRTCLNVRNGRFDATQGKMLGGSGGLHHMYHCHGDAYLYNGWGSKTGDHNWNYNNVKKYFKRSEQLIDESTPGSQSAKDRKFGGFNITKQNLPENQGYLDSYAELGYKIKDDLFCDSTLGFSQPLLHVANGLRTSGGLAFMSPIKNRPNLYMSLYSTATKILISDGKAKGVQMVDSNGDLFEFYAKHEVLVAAGAISTASLLVRSGIGPKDQIAKLNVPLHADLPVGQRFMDHPCVLLGYQMEASNASAGSTDYGEFPAPSTIGTISLNPSASYADVQIISLLFPHDSTAQVQLTSRVMGHTDQICDKLFEASKGRSTYLVLMHLARPKSSGKITVTSTNYADAPEIKSGYFEDDDDLTLFAKNLMSFNKIVDTSYFKKVNASFIDLGLSLGDPATLEYWKRYALEMSSSMRHYCCTAPMGEVLNSDLTVKGIQNLRVIDASAMPDIPLGEPFTSVAVIAERGSDLVLAKLASSKKL